MMASLIDYCPICGDFLFNGRHYGQIEQWCQQKLSETKIGETENREMKIQAVTTETKNRKRGRPRRETENPYPWVVAGISRATWYRRRNAC